MPKTYSPACEGAARHIASKATVQDLVYLSDNLLRDKMADLLTKQGVDPTDAKRVSLLASLGYLCVSDFLMEDMGVKGKIVNIQLMLNELKQLALAGQETLAILQGNAENMDLAPLMMMTAAVVFLCQVFGSGDPAILRQYMEAVTDVINKTESKNEALRSRHKNN